MDFREADLRYRELKQRYDAGTLGAAEFDDRLKKMMVQDGQNRWWVRSRHTGD